METLNICIATYRLCNGNGIDVSVLQFARELAKRHKVTLAFTSADMDLGGLDSLKYNIGPGTGMLGAARDIKKRRFDAISTHYPPFDLVASLSGTPHFLHDPGIPPFGVFKGFKDRWFWAKINASRLASARSALCVLPASRYLGNEFTRKYHYGGPIEVLPYGIEFPEREPEGMVPYGKYVLYVGRHAPYKGVHTLIEAFTEIQKEMEDVHLVTIGNVEDGYGKRLETIASRTKNVHMLGYVPDIWRYFACASVYATCSAWEGEDRPAIEAQYMGKPVVAFDSCSHPEVVIHGALAKDKEQLKDRLMQFLSDDHADLSVRAKIVEQYSIERMAVRFREIVRRYS